MATPDHIITPQFCFSERPETLDAVYTATFSRKLSFPVVNPVVPVAVGEEAVVGTKGVGINRAPLLDLLFDNETKDAPRDIWDGSGIHPAIAFEKPGNSHFPGHPSPTVAFQMSAEIRLVNFHLFGERRFALALARNGATDDVIDTFGAMPVDTEFSSSADYGYLKCEEMNEAPHQLVREAISFDNFVSHDLTIQKVKHLY